jgi:uncharacterized protein (UPF0335 family)
MDDAAFNTESVASDQLKSVIERLERVYEEIDGLKAGAKDILAEAKGNGLDPKIIKKCLAIRKKDHSERMEEEAIFDLYLQALGITS